MLVSERTRSPKLAGTQGFGFSADRARPSTTPWSVWHAVLVRNPVRAWPCGASKETINVKWVDVRPDRDQCDTGPEAQMPYTPTNLS